MAEQKPNFLIIIGDDCTFSDLPLYGGKNAKTPHIDQLATEGMLFNHAYVSMSMCLPCRSAMYTGQYPHRNGASWNHSACRPGTKSIVHHLTSAGYRVGLTGKKHVAPKASFPFEDVPGFEPSCVKQTAGHDVSGITEFMKRDADEPFCLVVGLVSPHVPWTVGDPTHFPKKLLALPDHLPDTPQTREDFSKYLAEIEVMDQQVHDTLSALEKTGAADKTLVIFTSEQGAQFPGCKWTNWDAGVHTGLIIRWPDVVKPNQVTDAMVQYEDILPTLAEIASADVPVDQFDGTSFLSVLTGDKSTHRQYVYSMHNNIPEGPPYPIRSIRTKDFRYIMNLSSDELYVERHLMGVANHNPYWGTWMHSSPFNDQSYRLIKRYIKRPAEELYLTSGDPSEMTNVANDEAYQKKKKELATELNKWMKSQNDPGIELDTRKVWNQRRTDAGLKARKN